MKNLENLINSVPAMDENLQLSTKGGDGEGGPNPWHALWNGIVGTTEFTVGVLTAETGVGTLLMIDGAGRVVMAIKNEGDEDQPSNIGGDIGQMINGQTGMLYGSIADDFIASLYGGSAIEAWQDMNAALDTGNVIGASGYMATFAGTINDSINYINSAIAMNNNNSMDGIEIQGTLLNEVTVIGYRDNFWCC